MNKESPMIKKWLKRKLGIHLLEARILLLETVLKYHNEHFHEEIKKLKEPKQ
jgi:hypothetical protein